MAPPELAEGTVHEMSSSPLSRVTVTAAIRAGSMWMSVDSRQSPAPAAFLPRTRTW